MPFKKDGSTSVLIRTADVKSRSQRLRSRAVVEPKIPPAVVGKRCSGKGNPRQGRRRKYPALLPFVPLGKKGGSTRCFSMFC